MDILDLDDGYFVQYKPSEITWPAPMEFTVVHVPRDREWMTRCLPIFREFWDQVEYYRQNLDELKSKIPAPKVRVPRPLKPPPPCAVAEDPDEDEYFSD
jgi:hypothetical protein